MECDIRVLYFSIEIQRWSRSLLIRFSAQTSFPLLVFMCHTSDFHIDVQISGYWVLSRRLHVRGAWLLPHVKPYLLLSWLYSSSIWCCRLFLWGSPLWLWIFSWDAQVCFKGPWHFYCTPRGDRSRNPSVTCFVEQTQADTEGLGLISWRYCGVPLSLVVYNQLCGSELC